MNATGQARQPFGAFSMAKCQPLEISRLFNFPGRTFRNAAWRELARLVRSFPAGPQRPWGIPFHMAPVRPDGRVIVLRQGEEARVPVGRRADYVCVLHTFHKLKGDETGYGEASPVGEYELRYADGSSHLQPIRARLDVPVPDSPGAVQMAVPFVMATAVDPTVLPDAPPSGSAPLPPGAWNQMTRWGALQYGFRAVGGEPFVFAIRNPHPGKRIAALVIRGRVHSPVLIAGITAYRGTAHPFRHLPRRMYVIRAAGERPSRVETVQVDLGAVARVDRTIGRRGATWLRSAYTGVTRVEEPEKAGEDICSIYGARDATVSVKLADKAKPVEFSLGEAFETGRSTRGRIELKRLGGTKQWMRVEILDESTGKPTPVRIHISGSAGEYIAPYGHHEQVNANWFEDYGADLRAGGRSFAYVPGVFTTDLPAGDLYVELFKGFEYAPIRQKVVVRPGQKKLTLRVNRWRDLRSAGWVTADTHVHFISPHTAWLEAQCEGVNVVNLLASQWGRLFTNVGDIAGRVGVAQDDTIVWVGTENRNHMLGHISMLGTRGPPVFPMCGGGVTESWMGDPDFRTLTEWARECRRKDGVVVRPHFPYCGFTEDPVLAVGGVLDALEIWVDSQFGFPVQEWYRYLNNGYRVAVAGGTDKMSASTALGYLRTYARLDRDRPFTFGNWARAMRAGRTFATTGPLIDLRVEEAGIGDTIRLPAGGGRLEVTATAECAWPLGRVEIVRNGAVLASEGAAKGTRRLAVSARIPITGSGWIAARCAGFAKSPAGFMAAHTSPVYVTCGRERPFDGPALEHMLNLTRGGIEYLRTISTPFSERDQERMIRIYRQAERHLEGRLRSQV